jgi:hypothetical protein
MVCGNIFLLFARVCSYLIDDEITARSFSSTSEQVRYILNYLYHPHLR